MLIGCANFKCVAVLCCGVPTWQTLKGGDFERPGYWRTKVTSGHSLRWLGAMVGAEACLFLFISVFWWLAMMVNTQTCKNICYYTCMQFYVYAYAYIHMIVHIYSIYIYVYVYLYIYIHDYVYICVCVCLCSCYMDKWQPPKMGDSQSQVVGLGNGALSLYVDRCAV